MANEPKPMNEDEKAVAQLDGMIWVLEKSGQLDKFKEKFGIAQLNAKLDKIYGLLEAIQKGLEDE